MRSYQVVKAKTHAEAVGRSSWKVGDKAEVKEIEAFANSDGTWSLFPRFGRLSSPNPENER